MAEARKTVTIIFADVTGSTALGEQTDPEVMRRLMERYFEEMRTVLEKHGGTVEKFIGDAVMAVFGIPTVHEDDALRAVRAAAEMRERLVALNEEFERDRRVTIALRTGVNTGEVIAGDPSQGQAFATGDAVNVAARLEQAAEPGEILLGELTHRLVREAVRAAAVDPLEVKGKSQALGAWRLAEMLPEVPALIRCIDAPFVGRDEELAKLCEAFESTRGTSSARLVTVLGPPGIGKSRLVRELLASAADDARVVVGRCLSYGEGITYWPLSEMVRQLAGAEPRAALLELLGAETDGSLATERLLGAIGATDEPARTEEIFWATRMLFERLARDQPLIAVVDDLHWAEPTFLDLIEYLIGFLDHVPSDERAVLIRGAVEGRLFHRGAVSSLLPETEREAVSGHLLALARKNFVRPDESLFPGDDAFRFVHVLVRDAAYEAAPKELRADLHEHFAGWLENKGADRLAELEEIVGYHLEQAYRYRQALGERGEFVAERAGERLASAGARALARGDMSAAVKLLRRAANLFPRDDERSLELVAPLAAALSESGEAPEGLKVLAHAEARARHMGVERLERLLRLQRYAAATFWLGALTMEKGRVGEGRDLREQGWSMLRELGLRIPLAIYQSVAGGIVGLSSIERDSLLERLQSAYDTLARAGEKGVLSTAAANLALVLYDAGDYEEAERLSYVSEEAGSPQDVATQAGWRAARAMVMARRGRFDEAERLALDALARARASDYVETTADSYLSLGEVLRLAGRAEEAREAVESALEIFERKGFALSAGAVRAKLAELQTSGSPSQ